jgi:hypothetical protein
VHCSLVDQFDFQIGLDVLQENSGFERAALVSGSYYCFRMLEEWKKCEASLGPIASKRER